MEIDVRNRLSDLKHKLIFTAEKDSNFDRGKFEEEYSDLMREANRKWLEVKQGEGKSSIH